MTFTTTSFALGIALTLVVSSAARQPVQHFETVGGASVRIARPEPWNGELVLLAGGYAPMPTRFEAGVALPEFAQALLSRGFAYAESGYSEGGLAIATAVQDVRSAKQRFIERHGTPKRTYAVGESKGGLIAVLLVETAPQEFDGGLAINGLLGAPMTFLQRAHELLSAFHSAFPGLLPNPNEVPATYTPEEATVVKVLNALRSQPATAATLRATAFVDADTDLAELLAFHTDALRDLQQRCSQNPFAAKTATSVPAPCARVVQSPTGKLQRPLVAVATDYDPVIPAWVADTYIGLVRQHNRLGLLTHVTLKGRGHLNISTADRLAAFSRLVATVRDGSNRPPR